MSKQRKARSSKRRRPYQRYSYLSHDGHKIYRYGRAFFWVTSASREKLRHLVDLEPVEAPHGGFFPAVCNCESWKYGDRPCRHIRAILEMFLSPLNLEQAELDHAIRIVSMRYSFHRKFPNDAPIPIYDHRLPACMYRHAA